MNNMNNTSMLSNAAYEDDYYQNADQDSPDNTYNQFQDNTSTASEDDPQTKNFDPYKIPPSLSLAELFWRATGIGRKHPDPKNKCPLSKKHYKIPYSLLKHPFTVTEYGTSIPLYFQFVSFAVTMWIFMFIAFYQIGATFRKVYCKRYTAVSGEHCSLFNTHSWMTGSVHRFTDEDFKEVRTTFLDNYVFSSVIFYLMFAFCYFFNWRQYVFIKKIEAKHNCESSSEFTLMIQDVVMEEPEVYVRDYIQELLNDFGNPECQIKKVNIAYYEGIFKKIEKIKEHLSKQRLALRMKSNYAERADEDKIMGIYDKLETNIEKKLDKIEKLEKIRKSQTRFIEESRKHAIAFVSFSTNLEKDMVLHCYNVRHCHILARAFFCCKKKPDYRISLPPEPDDVQWRYVGYTDFQRIWSYIWTKPIIILLLPASLVFAFAFKYLTALLMKINGDNLFYHYLIYLFNYLVTRYFNEFVHYAFSNLQKHEKELNKHSYLSGKAMVMALLKFSFLYVSCVTSSLSKDGVVVGPLNPQNINYQEFEFVQGLYYLRYMIIVIFVGPFFEYFSFGFYYSEYIRYKIRKAFDNDDNRFSDKPSKYLLMTQRMLSTYFERPDCHIEMLYSEMYFLMLLGTIFFRFSPFMSISIVLAILLKAGVDLILFYKRFRAPIPRTNDLSKYMAMITLYIPKFFLVGNFYELVLKGREDDHIGFWIRAVSVLNLVMVLMPFDLLFKSFDHYMDKKHMEADWRKHRVYDNEKKYFETDYETSNPATMFENQS